jgi:hypothetical protein
MTASLPLFSKLASCGRLAVDFLLQDTYLGPQRMHPVRSRCGIRQSLHSEKVQMSQHSLLRHLLVVIAMHNRLEGKT